MNYGVHDFFIPEKSPHTFGVNLGILGEKTINTRTHLNGIFTAFLVNDQDKLDPYYELLWYKMDTKGFYLGEPIPIEKVIKRHLLPQLTR
jgi:hypothetical protein